MKYTIQYLDSFWVIGQEIILTNSQRKNIQISTQFWPKFNADLKREQLSQSNNWVKYAFMERRNDVLFYYCAIPKVKEIPEGFIAKEIKAHKYLVVEHRGLMSNIYQTYGEIYQEILPNSKECILQEDFLHFERYDFRFQWNKINSIIEIWVPLQD